MSKERRIIDIRGQVAWDRAHGEARPKGTEQRRDANRLVHCYDSDLGDAYLEKYHAEVKEEKWIEDEETGMLFLH